MKDSAGEQIPEGNKQCPICHGSGERAPDVECRKCEGSGYVPNPQDDMSIKEEATLLASFTEDGQVRIQSAGGYLWTDDNDKDVASIEKGSGMYFPERQIADLKAKLEAAEKRIKDLESQINGNYIA